MLPIIWRAANRNKVNSCVCMEKEMAPHSSPLAWKIPWREEPAGRQSMELLRVGHDLATSLSLFSFMHWRRKWHPTPVFLPGESHGQSVLAGYSPWGRKESDRTERQTLSLSKLLKKETNVKGILDHLSVSLRARKGPSLHLEVEGPPYHQRQEIRGWEAYLIFFEVGVGGVRFVAGGILACRPRIKAALSAAQVQNLNPWLAREVRETHLNKPCYFFNLLSKPKLCLNSSLIKYSKAKCLCQFLTNLLFV